MSRHRYDEVDGEGGVTLSHSMETHGRRAPVQFEFLQHLLHMRVSMFIENAEALAWPLEWSNGLLL